ncbi:hypothetical protein [Brachybacterium sp. GPGPB12]|uniref:hypothetical protein n=1 Tax=Brachybacterium sp. GPGPB12 TaxID=3023517 RepID=UPI00313423DB
MTTPESVPTHGGARRDPAPVPRVPGTARHRRDETAARTVPPMAGTARGDALWWLIAVAAVLACTWLYWDIAQTALAPRTPWDEGHPMQTARWIAGERGLTPVSGSGYYPGWAVMIAPVWWFTDDAYAVYTAAVWIGNLLALATIAPLAAIARRFGVSWPQGIAISAVVMMFPGRSLLADYALSERPLMLFYALTALAVHRLWEKPSWGRAAAPLAAATGAFFIHSRALAPLGTVAIWFLCFCLRNWRIGLAGAAGAVLVWRVVGPLAEALAETVSLRGYGKEDVVAPGARERLAGPVRQGGAEPGVGAGPGVPGAHRGGRADRRPVHGGGAAPPAPGDPHLLPRPGAVGVPHEHHLVDPGLPAAPPDGGRRFDAWVYSRYLDNIGAILSVIALAYLLAPGLGTPGGPQRPPVRALGRAGGVLGGAERAGVGLHERPGERLLGARVGGTVPGGALHHAAGAEPGEPEQLLAVGLARRPGLPGRAGADGAPPAGDGGAGGDRGTGHVPGGGSGSDPLPATKHDRGGGVRGAGHRAGADGAGLRLRSPAGARPEPGRGAELDRGVDVAS